MIGISEEPIEEAIAFTSSAIDDSLYICRRKFRGLQANEVRVFCMGESRKQNGQGALLYRDTERSGPRLGTH